MGGKENEQMGIGQDWVCFDAEKECGGKDEVLWPHRPKNSTEKIVGGEGEWERAGEGGRERERRGEGGTERER